MTDNSLSASTFASLLTPLLPSPVPPLAVAVSGGVDSMALSLLAADWAKAQGTSLLALTVDHGLRPDSAEEAECVSGWMAARGIRHRILRWHPETLPKSNRQAAAREARYRLLAAACKEENIRHLLVAHHLDDQAETFLLRLQRGSGVDGLAAMQTVSEKRGLMLLRPLLDTPKQALVDYLTTEKQKWVEDPSNQDTRHNRVRMRQILPQLAETGITPEGLAATAQRMRRARNYLEQQTAKAAEDCLTLHHEGYITLHFAQFKELHEEIALRLLADILRWMNHDAYRPRLSELESLLAALPDARTLGGCRFAPAKGDTLCIFREMAHIAPPVALRPQETIIWDGRFAITLHSDFPVMVSAFNAPLPEAEIPFPRRILPTLPCLRGVDNMPFLPHIHQQGEKSARQNPMGIRCEIRVFPLRNTLGCG